MEVEVEGDGARPRDYTYASETRVPSRLPSCALLSSLASHTCTGRRYAVSAAVSHRRIVAGRAWRLRTSVMVSSASASPSTLVTKPRTRAGRSISGTEPYL